MDSNDISSLKYTSREYLSIFEDLYKAIPSLTKKWTSREETDPGIVLVKLMAMLGDMLSYTQDKATLEAFPATVTQRKNAVQIFGLIGYKMHGYVSATCKASFQQSLNKMSIEPYTKYTTKNSNICYSNLEEIRLTNIPSAWTLTQGIPVTPKLAENPESNSYWYDKYDYNISASDIDENNRYYFKSNTEVADGSVFLIDDTGTRWYYPDYTGQGRISLDLESRTGRFFDVEIDEYDKPYIQFPSNWNQVVYAYNPPSKFKLFYLQSAGEAGSIAENTLYDSQGCLVSNEASTNGYNIETPEEARLNINKYRNTISTLITLDDYKNATLRVTRVNNCIATDFMTDPYETSTNTINLYVVPDDRILSGSEVDRENFKTTIYTSLRDYSCIPREINIDLYDPQGTSSKIVVYKWSPTGEVYLHSPVTSADAQDILNRINTRLQYVYSTANVAFNTPIDYVDLVSEIMEADSRIRYVNLDNIMYNGGEASAKDVSGRVTNLSGTVLGTGVASFTNLGSIKPSSVLITCNINGIKYELHDLGYPNSNGIGSMVTAMYLNRTDPLVSSSVDYRNGIITLEFSNVPSDVSITYTKNKIGICHYAEINLDPNDSNFYIAPESLKI